MKNKIKDNDLKSWLAQIGETEVPGAVKQSLQAQLNEFERELTEKSGPGLASRISEYLQKLFSPGIRLAVGFAVLLIVIFWGTFYFGPTTSNGDLYAAVVQQLRMIDAIAYEIVISEGASVSIAKTESGLSRIATSWGIEFLTDHIHQKQLILFHYMQKYLLKEKDIEDRDTQLGSLYETFKKLPDKAEENLGERDLDGTRVKGYRVTDDGDKIDIWINPTNNTLVQVDINFYQEQIRVHQMQIKNIQLNEQVELGVLNFEPPVGYEVVSKVDKKVLEFRMPQSESE